MVAADALATAAKRGLCAPVSPVLSSMVSDPSSLIRAERVAGVAFSAGSAVGELVAGFAAAGAGAVGADGVAGLEDSCLAQAARKATLKASASTSLLREIVVELVDLRCTTLQLEIDDLQAQIVATPKADERYPREQKLARQCNRLAWLMAGAQRSPHRAVLLARQAVAVDPNNAHYVDTLARCLFIAGDVTKAVALARHSLHLDPGNPDFRNNVRQYENARLQSYIAGRSELNPELK